MAGLKAKDYILDYLKSGPCSKDELKRVVSGNFSPSTFYSAFQDLVTTGKVTEYGSEVMLPHSMQASDVSEYLSRLTSESRNFVDQDTEMLVMGSIIDAIQNDNKKKFDSIIHYLDHNAFYTPMLNSLFRKITESYDMQDVNGIMTSIELSEDEKTFINSDFVKRGAMIRHNSLVGVLNTRARRRSALGQIGESLRDYINNGNDDAFLDEIMAAPSILIRGKRTTDLISTTDLVIDVVKEIEAVKSGELMKNTVSFGYPVLDSRVGMMGPGHIVVIAARPGSGKTTLAMNIALESAAKSNTKTLFMSLEMDRSEVGMRMISCESGIGARKLQLGEYSAHALKEVHEAASRLSKYNILVDDMRYQTPRKIRSRMNKLMNENPPDLIIIDYLQLLDADYRYRSEYEKLTSITRELKLIAGEFKKPIILLSQMNREFDKREGGARLSDLRGSGSIEQDADVVAFLEPANDIIDGAGQIKFTVKKNRHGALNDVIFDVDLKKFKFRYIGI